MKKIYHSLKTAIRTAPFYGRTFLVLSFFFLLIKQACIVLTYGQVFQEATLGAILSHYLGYFVSDFIVCLVILGLVIINVLLKKRYIKTLNNIIISGIFLLFVLDIFTMYFFQSKLSILDMNQFVNSSLASFSGIIVFVVIILCILSIISFLIAQSKIFKKSQKFILSLYLFIFALGSFLLGIYVPGGFKSIPDNIISTNISAIKKYHQQSGINYFLEEDSKYDKFTSFFEINNGLGKKPNIIVVFAESFSAIDSLRVGGINDNLPYFDKIQKEGITFTNFTNNGCTSDTAHIGLLLGVEPIKLPGSNVGAYSGFKNFTESLPVFFSKQGYSPIFISAVDIDFLGQRDFLSSIGFTHIIEENAFEKEKKYVFDAAPDLSLYKKTLETINEQTGSFFIVLQSISFHKPYYTPYGKTESDALRYSDKSLYYFYLQLKKSGFFDNGILVITTDHRKMEPLEKNEQEALGDFWYTKGVATIVGTDIIPGTINTNIIQHTDIFYSLKKFTSKGLVTVSKIFNDAFSSTKKRDRGLVYCRYFEKNNKYTIVEKNNTGATFNNLSQISTTHSFVHKYITSYITFQNGSGNTNFDATNIVFIGHQGSPNEAPENSLEGFQLAKKNGANGIEMDVSYTKDKKLIVMHGKYTRGTVCRDDYIIYNNTLNKLKEKCPMKNGEEIKTLEEMLGALNNMFDYYFIDIKIHQKKHTEQQIQEVIDIVKKLNMEDNVILSSYDDTARKILGNSTGIIAGWDTFDIQDIDSLSYTGYQYFMIPYTTITGNIIQKSDDLGKIFVTYTINTTGELEQLYNQGVRMVMTDNIPLLKNRAENFLK